MADHIPLTAGPAAGPATQSVLPPQPAASEGVAASWRTFLQMLCQEPTPQDQVPQQPSDSVLDTVTTSKAAQDHDPEQGSQTEVSPAFKPKEPDAPQLPFSAGQGSIGIHLPPTTESRRTITSVPAVIPPKSNLTQTEQPQTPVAAASGGAIDMNSPDATIRFSPPEPLQERARDPAPPISTDMRQGKDPHGKEWLGNDSQGLRGRTLNPVLAEPAATAAPITQVPQTAGRYRARSEPSLDSFLLVQPVASKSPAIADTPQAFRALNQGESTDQPIPLQTEKRTGLETDATAAAPPAIASLHSPASGQEHPLSKAPAPAVATQQTAAPADALSLVNWGAAEASAALDRNGSKHPADIAQPDTRAPNEFAPKRPPIRPSIEGADLPAAAQPSSLITQEQVALPGDPPSSAIPDLDTSGARLALATPASPLTQTAPTAGPQAAPQPQAQAVLSQLQAQLPKTGEAIEITLSPKELGTVKLIAQPGETGLTLAILAERPETQDLMRKHLDLLQSELRKAGFSTLDFGTERNGSGSDGMADKAADRTSNEAQSPPLLPEDGLTASDTGVDRRLSTSATPAIDGRLDIRL